MIDYPAFTWFDEIKAIVFKGYSLAGMNKMSKSISIVGESFKKMVAL